MENSIAVIDSMRQEIALIENLEDVKHLHDEAQALLHWAKLVGESLEVQNKCAEVRLRLERKAGQFLIDKEIRPGNPNLAGEVGESETLQNLGITKNQSSRWQRIAFIPEGNFEDYIGECYRRVLEITTAGALKLFRLAAREKARDAIMETDASLSTSAGHIVSGDMVEKLLDMDPQFADLILTDPPYGLGETSNLKFQERANMSESAGEWDSLDPGELFFAWCEIFRRAIKPEGSIYCFVADRFISKMIMALEYHGFVVRGVLVWKKTNPPPSVRRTTFRSDVEYIIYATAGEKYTGNWLGQQEMLKCQTFPICSGKERLDHPTQKPVKLLKQYIEVSSNVGGLVLDPFAGVGSTGAACVALGRSYLLIEEDEYYVKQASIRLQETT